MNKLYLSVISLAMILTTCLYAQADDWTGFYAFGGIGADKTEYNLSIPILPVSLYTPDYNASGFQAVVGVKYDWDLQNQFVVGIGANGHWSNQSVVANVFPTIFAATIEQNFGYDIFATLGYKIDEELLLYGIAGTTTQNFSGTHIATGLSDNWRISGWQFGAGIEAAINEKWHINLEYRHTNFGNEDFGTSGLINLNTTNQSIIAGIKYKLN